VAQIEAEARLVPGVETVGPVRVRQSGADIFVDLSIQVGRSASLEEAHRIATGVEHRIAALVHGGDVVVHVDPVRPPGENLPQAVNAIAGRLGLRVHNVHAHEVRGRSFIDLHVEVPPELTLAQAHAEASRLEAAVRRELPYVHDVHTHIEPYAVPAAPATLDPREEARLRARITAVVGAVAGLGGCHQLYIRPGPLGYDVVLHCRADPDLAVGAAHRLADQAEKRLYAEMPGLGQVLIHLEPAGERNGSLD
jgi:divalent metal cation (Fe/Co/Zn/Cd) transporter